MRKRWASLRGPSGETVLLTDWKWGEVQTRGHLTPPLRLLLAPPGCARAHGTEIRTAGRKGTLKATKRRAHSALGMNVGKVSTSHLEGGVYKKERDAAANSGFSSIWNVPEVTSPWKLPMLMGL